MKRLAVMVGLVVLLAPGRAELGRIHYEAVTLDRMLAMSPIIVVVGPPQLEQRTVDLGDGVEPYRYAEARYPVVEYLRPPRPAKEGETLTVSGFDPASFSLHVAYYTRGISRSPIWPHYEAAHPPADGEDMILFLKRATLQRYDPSTETLNGNADTHASVVSGAVEGVEARAGLAPRAAEPCGCVDTLGVTVAVPGVTEAIRDEVSEALQARFPGPSALSWQVIDTRPKRGPG